MKACLSVLAALFLCGCISDEGGVEKPEVGWKVGKTTRREVVATWGNPDAVLGDVWIWRDHTVSGGKLKASYLMIGVTVKNLSTTLCEFRLRFDADGKLSSIEQVDYAPGGKGWSINPWN